jgi:predicted HTH domain antitoxin
MAASFFMLKLQQLAIYTIFMAQVTLDLPEVLSSFLTSSGQNLERAALEAIALEAYRERKLSTAQLRRLLGYHTRTQVHAFLKEHGVYLHYGLADLEHDRQAGDTIQPPTA